MAKLFIICGHGAGDSGACGNGYREAERVRALAKRIKHYGGSSVTVGNTNRNWYADDLINNKNIPKGSVVIELHMDSGVKGAKGAHVIIKKGYSPDKYDEALAAFVSRMFPGRSSILVGRGDLANPNRAARAGINYRLIECGFISNADDVKKFNSNIDELAKGILKACDVAMSEKTDEKKGYSGKFPKLPGRGYYLEGDGYERLTSYKAEIKKVQMLLNWIMGTSIAVDGNYGPNTEALCATYQKKYELKVDGSFGSKSLEKAKTIKK